MAPTVPSRSGSGASRVAFEARAKARPRGPMIRVGAGVRVRRDRIDNNGKVTLRQPDPPAITSAWDTPTRAKRVIMLVNGLDVRVVSQDGELLGSSRLIRPGTTSLRDEASTMPRHIRPRCADTSHKCPGWDSNPHVPFGTSAFKAHPSASSGTRAKGRLPLTRSRGS